MNILSNNNKNNIKKELLPELLQQKNAMLITGFASLDFFADFVKSTKNQKLVSLKLLLGAEFTDLETRNNKDIRKVVESYWKKRGFSLKSIKSIKILRDILAGDKTFPYLYDLEVRIDATNRAQHSKIYETDDFISIGSSNFTNNGFSKQKETNIVIYKNQDGFAEMKSLCQEYWSVSEDYKYDLLELLDNLLSVVNYKQVLKLIHDDFINGEWYNSTENEEIQKLWKHQELTVAETLISLNNTGAAIIAEPTGSGKTKASVEVVRNLYERYFLNGYNYMSPPRVTVVAPPRVEMEWLKELENYGIYEPKFISSGILSQSERVNQTKESNLDRARAVLSKTDILLIDEAHDYKELENNRALNLLKYNAAEYTLFLTATPMNKGIKDYFGFLVLIGANSLEERHINSINEIFQRNIQNISNLNSNWEKNILADYVKAIKSVTIRKTKYDINQISINNKTKTYPKEITKEYKVEIRDEDKVIIKKIKELSERLYGIAFFSEQQKEQEQRSITLEKDKSRGIAKWKILYYLRSSPISLLYHIKGSEYVIKKYNLKENISFRPPLSEKIKNKNKRLLRRIGRYYDNEENTRYLDDATSDFGFENLKETEIFFYEQISNLVEMLSDDIVDSKVRKILEKSKDNNKIVVFDRTPLSVIYFYQKLKEKVNDDIDVFYAIGDNGEDGRDIIKNNFSHHNEKTKYKKTIGICSNVLSESVNLEVANVEIFLDIPTTPIIAEQRIGRISRMSSTFEKIEIYWPHFINELMLNTDKLLCERLHNINQTISGNINIPPFLIEYSKKIENYENIKYSDLNIEDNEDDKKNFEYEVQNINIPKTVKDLFYKEDSLIYDIENCNTIKKHDKLYAFIKDDSKWGLFYVQNEINNIPSLCFIEENLKTGQYNVFYDYDDICKKFHSKKDVLQDSDFYLLGDSILEKTLQDYEIFIETEFSKESLTSKEKGLLKLLSLMVEDMPSEYSFIKDYLTNPDFKNKKTLANNWFQFIKKHWIEYISVENESKSKLPIFSDLYNSLSLRQDFSDYKKLKKYLESGINNKSIGLKIKAAILSIPR